MTSRPIAQYLPLLLVFATNIDCLRDQKKSGFFPANERFLKTSQIALIGWIKAGPPKKRLLF